MKKILFAIVGALVLGFVVTNAQAAPINLAYGDAYYVGLIDPGIPASEYATYLPELLKLSPGGTSSKDFGGSLGVQDFSRVDSTLTGLPSSAGLFGSKTDTDVGPTLTVGSIVYVIAKYDGPNAGLLVWYLGGLAATDQVVLPTNWGPAGGNQYGISNYATFSKVPEPGTMLLLGSGLLGLAVVGARRKFRK